MQITSTEFFAETVQLTIENEDDFTLGDTAPKITVRMPLAGGETAPLAFHHLATLKQARDVIGAEIQRLTHTLDQIA